MQYFKLFCTMLIFHKYLKKTLYILAIVKSDKSMYNKYCKAVKRICLFSAKNKEVTNYKKSIAF